MATPPNLLERDAELSELRAALERAEAERGQVIVLEGFAGTGKSALVAAAVTEATERGLRVLQARGSELEREFAFGTVRQLFEPVLTSAAAPERERLLAGSAAPAEWVLDGSSAVDTTRTRAEAGLTVLHAIYWLTANLGARTPLLVAVDDLHWADESSLRSLAYLGRRVSDLPVALLVALRPSEPDSPAALLDEIRAEPGAVRIVPSALNERSVANLVRGQIPEAGDDLCAAFHEASAGNPLYLHELLLTVAADDLAADTDAIAKVRRASIPTLGERLSRRIARVDPAAQDLTAAMAVLGDASPLAIAAAIAGVPEDVAADVALKLTEIRVLANDDPFSFAHPVLRRTVYDGLSATEREAAHSAAATILRDRGTRAEIIAVHVSALSPAGSAEVAAALVESARHALSRASPETAIRLLRRALSEGATEPGRPAVVLELGRAEMAVRDPAAAAHLEEAFEIAEGPDMRADVAISLADLLVASGQWDKALAVLNEAKGENSSPAHLLELEAFRAVMLAYDPRLVDDFERERHRFTELCRAEGWAAHALASVLASVTAMRCEGTPTVMEFAERALEDGRLLTQRGAGAWAASQILWALVAVDEYERALEVVDQVAEEGRRTGSLIGVLTAGGYRGQVLSRSGDLRAAEAELRGVLDFAVQSGMALWVVSAFHLFFDCILERPSLADVADLTRTLELDPVFLRTTAGAMLLELRGRLALQAGDRQRALPDLEACASTFGAAQLGPTYSPWRSALALALAPADRERADSLVAEELRLARASGLARCEGVALRAAGLLEGGARGIELLRESVAKCEGSPAHLEHARSLVELGAALRRDGRRAEAREHLASGMTLAHRCGAERLVSRADEELRAAGARPRRPAQTGTESLTPSELRVARLAARGLSNPEIAQELFVSTKTVESHLSSTYTKLGLAGQGARKQLAAAFRR